MLTEFVAGRAAEEIVFDTVTTGAANDIEKATKLARAMVTQYGMSRRFGLVGLESPSSQYLDDGRIIMNCSEETAAEVDREVIQILKEAYEEAKMILKAHRSTMDRIAAFLIERETITGKEFMDILHQVEGTMESASSSRISENPLPESGKETEKAVTLEKKPEDASSSRMETPRDTVSGVEETEAIEAPETKGMEQTLSGNSSEQRRNRDSPSGWTSTRWKNPGCKRRMRAQLEAKSLRMREQRSEMSGQRGRKAEFQGFLPGASTLSE